LQEIALVLSSVAGVFTAAAIKKIPRNRNVFQSIGINPQIKSQKNALKIEKEILTKTISRLYETADLTAKQRDTLLTKYQHQLGVVIAKLEKLESLSKHPDLGPIGDGLVTLMDQKLSQLDERLYELSSKITIANTQKTKPVSVPQKSSPIKQESKQVADNHQNKNNNVIETVKSNETLFPKPDRKLELTTLTELPSKIPEFFKIKKETEIQKKFTKPNEEQIQTEIKNISSKTIQKSFEEPKNKSQDAQQEIIPQIQTKQSQLKINLPDMDNIEEDEEDDIEKIKGDIMKTLSKLEQAEVE